MGGQIIDASIVAVPKQRNSRKENARIKAGDDAGMLAGSTPANSAPKGCRGAMDQEARSGAITATRTHINVDRRHKLETALIR